MKSVFVIAITERIASNIYFGKYFCDNFGRDGTVQNRLSCAPGAKWQRELGEEKPPMLVDTEYDRAKVPPYNGNDPRSPLVVSKPFCFHPY